MYPKLYIYTAGISSLFPKKRNSTILSNKRNNTLGKNFSPTYRFIFLMHLHIKKLSLKQQLKTMCYCQNLIFKIAPRFSFDLLVVNLVVLLFYLFQNIWTSSYVLQQLQDDFLDKNTVLTSLNKPKNATLNYMVAINLYMGHNPLIVIGIDEVPGNVLQLISRCSEQLALFLRYSTPSNSRSTYSLAILG